jgi:hypothetical protein
MDRNRQNQSEKSKTGCNGKSGCEEVLITNFKKENDETIIALYLSIICCSFNKTAAQDSLFSQKMSTAGGS